MLLLHLLLSLVAMITAETRNDHGARVMWSLRCPDHKSFEASIVHAELTMYQ